MRRAFLIHLLMLGACTSGAIPVAPGPTVAAVSAPAGAASSGTGFFVRQDGVLVTAAHVVAGCRSVVVASPALRRAAQVIATEAASDLAVLRAAGTEAPGVVAMGPGAGAAGASAGFGYAGRSPTAVLEQAAPTDVTDQVRVRANDPRFGLWWRDERITHGWSGGPVLRDGVLSGVILEVFTDLNETARVLGRPQTGIAAGADAGSVVALLRRAGIEPGGAGSPARAIVRVFCVDRAGTQL